MIYAECHARGDIEETVLQRIANFFVFYHREQGKTFKPLAALVQIWSKKCEERAWLLLCASDEGIASVI